MKKLTLLFMAAAMMTIGSVSLFGQGRYGADSAECVKYLSYYKEYYKQKNYDDALPNWRKAFKICPPSANQTMLVDGTTLIRQLINKNKSNSVYKDALVDTLIRIHDLRAENFPKYATTAINNKGLDMVNYLQDEPKALYDGLKSVISANKENSKPQFFLFLFNAACSLYESGVLTSDDVLNDFGVAMSYMDKMPANDDTQKIRTDIENLLATSNVASCENLIALFQPRFDATPDDLSLVTNIVKVMGSTEGCTDNDLFFNAANKMHELDPSSSSAYFLYKLYAGREDIDNAIKYMEEAIAAEDTDAAQDAQYYFELATFCYKNSSNAKAFEGAMKAAELDSSLAGKCYLLIGSIWGSQVCPGNEIEKRAPYWVAVDYLVKAKNADPSLAEDANKLIAQYSQYFPQTAEAFMYNYNKGDSYTVSCGGMRAVTTVRTQD
ncbi:MAG: hypothetical protein IAB80_01435 [Bacteroidetes bacterium]|uniref:Tetratricopeptide repeat protein n=1 Tax=Candidatus Cryptobacteroides excrementipullorum TaxID=2840761 RepID=A0A9D9ISV2_9BACT|nr:hypothetical protein [Candidatus Cryptobacteroides excrementipullorum]